VYANTSTSFERGYVDIAECLKLPGRTDQNANIKLLVQAALSHRESGHWILIIDNADDIDVLSKRDDDSGSMALVDYLPDSYTGSIVFTTRTRKAAISLAENNMIHVDEMSRDDAMEVLRKTLLQTDLLSDEITVTRLLETLCYLPLAITQAVSYINKNDISIAEYTDLCESSEEDIIEVLSEDFEDKGRYKDMKNPVARTWLISFSQICRQDKLAGEYLSFMACLVRENIPRSLLPVALSRKKAVDAMGTLTAYSFVTKHKSDDLLDMHRLVHIATRNWLNNENELSAWTDKALLRLADIFPSEDHKNRAMWSIYLPHARYVLSQRCLSNINETKKIVLLDKVGRCLWSSGQYYEAEQVLREVLELYKRVLGPEHPYTLTSIYEVARALGKQGNYRKAEQMHREVLELDKRMLGPEHPYTLMSIHEVARALSKQGNYHEAGRMHQEVLELRKRVLGPEHPNTLKSIHRVAQALSKQGNYHEAEQVLREVLALRQRVLGPEHPNTLTNMHDIAQALSKQGNHCEAEQMLREVLELYKRVLGPEHPYTLTSIYEVARALSKQGNYCEAEQMFRGVLELDKRVLGPEHPDTLRSISSIAYILQKRGRYDEASIYYQQACLGFDKVLGSSHPIALQCSSDYRAMLDKKNLQTSLP
jgi:tetratricopeptide (TPR) repeat protein